MLIYANYLKNDTADLNFVFNKRSAITILANTKMINQIYCSVKMRGPKNQMLGTMEP